MKVKDLVYYILDNVKVISDDSIINEGHVMFLIKKYRSFLIKKEQEKEKATQDEHSEFEVQEICLNLEKVPAIDGEPCTGGYYLRTKEKIPKLLDDTTPSIYPIDYYQGIHICYVPRGKMRYIGTNKYLQNIIYVSLAPNYHLYFNSNNPQFLYLQKIRLAGTFEDYDEASKLLCDSEGNDTSCDPLEMEFPIRDYLVPTLLELCIKDITGAAYKPKEDTNNAKDDLADIASYIRRNTKSNLSQQLDS